MKRRKFINTTLAASALPLTYSSANSNRPVQPDGEKALIELRTYEMKFGGKHNHLINYLNEALKPALKRAGVNHFQVFNELGKEEPRKIWVLISYPNASTYFDAQQLNYDAEYVKAAADYNALPQEETIYNRFTSSLMLAFDGMPQVAESVPEASLYELRTYEGYSEDAVRRKISMFNEEEIALFDKVGLHTSFFGEMISGPYRPCLVYLLNFKDMDERNTNWGKFGKHPDWNTMKVKPEYANSVSNIRKLFLEPL